MKLLSPLQTFLIASIGIHGGLFVVSDSLKLTLPGSTGSVMSIKLDKPIKASVPQQKIGHRQTPLQKQAETKAVNKTVKKLTQQKTVKPAEQQPAQEKNIVSKAQVVSLIYKELSNHFTYPRIAQKRNWQGQVLLAFRLNTDGTIDDIKINHSSGYNVLDQAAIVSLKKIGQLPQVSSWLFDGMEIQLPVIYQLTQG